MLGLRMIMGGMSSLSMGIGVQKLNMMMSITSTMIIKLEDSMIIWMPRVITTFMIVMLTMIVIVTTKWMRIITLMIMQHMTLVKGIGLGIWSVNIGAQRGHSPEISNTEVLVFNIFDSLFCAKKGLQSSSNKCGLQPLHQVCTLGVVFYILIQTILCVLNSFYLGCFEIYLVWNLVASVFDI